MMQRALLLALLAAASLAPLAHAEDPKPASADPEAAAFQAMVEKLRPYVAKVRGLAWKHDVPAAVLKRDELETFFREKLAQEMPKEKLELFTRLARRSNMIKPTEDPVELQLMMFKEMVAGFYDPDTKRFYVIEGLKGEGMMPTIAHELVHALDDQHFDLEKQEKPYRDNDPDRSFAIRCIWEGVAEWVRRDFEDKHPEASQAAMRQQAENTTMAEAQARILFNQVPAHLVVPTLLHYRIGPNFVTSAVKADLPGGTQRIMADPPTTQEQVIHPYKWLGEKRDYPRKVVWGGDFEAAAGSGWKKVHETTIGELDFAVGLDYFLGDNEGRLTMASMATAEYVAEVASRAARGWDGAKALFLEDEAKQNIVYAQAMAFDSERDAEEALAAMLASMEKAYGTHWAKRTVTDAGPNVQDFQGQYGLVRIERRGNEIVLLDGGDAAMQQRLWPLLQKTKFEKHPQDAGDDLEAMDPFKGLRDRRPPPRPRPRTPRRHVARAEGRARPLRGRPTPARCRSRSSCWTRRPRRRGSPRPRRWSRRAPSIPPRRRPSRSAVRRGSSRCSSRERATC